VPEDLDKNRREALSSRLSGRQQVISRRVAMPQIPDLTDPRYLDELGWFLYHEKFRRDQFGGTYEEERLAYSQLLLDEVLSACQRERGWLVDKTVVTIGCGCTGDLATWPAAVKIGVDPLLYTYQKLGMLIRDAPGTVSTVYMSVGIEDLPLLDECVDVVVCRNALDHVPDSSAMLHQIRRILKPHGFVYLSVDIGGSPTPDEPTVFTIDSLTALIAEAFTVVSRTDDGPPHSRGRVCAVRILARKAEDTMRPIDKEAVLDAYLARLPRADDRQP
jgi:2-polyprenyl-3-methyl-5-hydroxy-6-metoxy-1,4-benzoquinol methylase